MHNKLRFPAFPLLIIITVMLLSGCGLFGGELQMGDGASPLPPGPAYAVCSEACLNQGQCGEAKPVGQDAFVAVLANSSGPATQTHTNLTAANSEVTILESRPETMQLVADPNSLFTLQFYNVTITARDNAVVWIPGWCIANQTIE
ncbi:MAG: hypothetical protein M9941_16570 [Anaerolineae bacterium]|nr:hypothetical protein [Anaerolineae bacterium]MCO5199360.1 hypothetical protein [Anaerolineae bacterium]